MSRITTLKQRPRRTLGVLTAVLVALGVVVASGADFSATTANPGNSFAAGTLSMTNSAGDGTAFLTLTNLRPGGPTQDGTIDIKNTGSLAGDFTVKATNITNSDSDHPLAPKLNIVIRDCGVFTGTDGTTAPDCGDGGDVIKSPADTQLSDLTTAVNLGNYPAGTKHRYRFETTLDTSADNDYQGDNATARLQWDATQ